jgi:hypothetical protein|tara:strand:+ start:763 stop:1446 length:684 start_codon:yes stop_codon:yes gene_type:complete
MGRVKAAWELGKWSWNVAKKAFPGRSKKVHQYFDDQYSSARTHMSEESAFQYAKSTTREKFKELQFKKPKGKLLGGLLRGPGGQALKALIKSKGWKKQSKHIKDETKKQYKIGRARLQDAEKKKIREGVKDDKFMKTLENLDVKRKKTIELGRILTWAKSQAVKNKDKKSTRAFRKARRGMADYGKKLTDVATAVMHKRVKRPKMNSQGGIMKFTKGGHATYYKDII